MLSQAPLFRAAPLALIWVVVSVSGYAWKDCALPIHNLQSRAAVLLLLQAWPCLPPRLKKDCSWGIYVSLLFIGNQPNLGVI